jgi:hypothetical protein
MVMGMRFQSGGRKTVGIAIGACLMVGVVAGCKVTSTAGGSPTMKVTTASAPTATASASGQPTPTPTASKTKTGTTTRQSPTAQPTTAPPATVQPPTAQPPTAQPTVMQSATVPAQVELPPPPPPAASSPADNPTMSVPTSSQAPAGLAAITANCPALASTSASGCGSWDVGPSSGQAPGFAAGQQSSPNLLDINQDPWSGGQGSQLLSASSFQNWSVTATDTDPSDSPGEVLTYPDASFNYYQLGSPTPAKYDLNNITSLTSDFAESMPQVSTVNAEAAYDLWLNNWQTEVMVWVDTSPGKDRNLADSGDTKVGTYTFGGQNFSLWRNGSGITGFYIFLLDHSETSGTVDLKSMLETLVSLGEIPAASPLTEIPFGWEVSDTGGKPATFSLSKFEVTLQN